jgi:predicted DNA-binding transcriptional regulator YafY
MRLDRLISILVVLMKKERVSAKELAEMFGVSTRTILRDIDTIDMAGIPIVTFQGTNGGIAIAEGYKLDRSVFNHDEIAAILSSLKGVARSLHDVKHDLLVDKITSVVNKSQGNRLNMKANQLIIDMSPWGGNDYLKERLSLIRSAIDQNRLISFNYINSSMSRSERRAEPYALVLKGQSWYLYAFCLLRNEPRLFKLPRISDLIVLDEGFEPRNMPADNLPWEEEWAHPRNLTEITLLFDAFMGNVVRETFGDMAEECGEGRFIVKIKLPVNNWLYGFILSFGPGVEVLEPVYLRKILREMSEKIALRYADTT